MTVNPFRQIVWWSRPYGEFLANGVVSQDTYIGGAYQVDIGHVFLKYCETASTASTNLWSALDGSTTSYWAESGAAAGAY